MTEGFRKILGKSGEDLAAEYLEQHGFEIILRNVRNKIGELDIVATKGKQIVIVEVKTKTGLGRGTPEEMVNPQKQRKLIRTAQLFLLERELLDHPWRIDVVAIRMQGSTSEILHLENAVEDR